MIRSRYALFLGFTLGLLAAAVLGLLLFRKPYSYQGSLIEPALPAPDFTLTTQSNQSFTLSEQFGKPVLIFFGYTHCPDVCPVMLSKYKKIRQSLGLRADDVIFLFVSVDPERDTPAVIEDYLQLFDPAIIGLTGNVDELESVWQAYGVIRDVKDAASENYLVDHTVHTFLVDLDNNLRLLYPFSFGVEGIVEDLSHMLMERNE